MLSNFFATFLTRWTADDRQQTIFHHCCFRGEWRESVIPPSGPREWEKGRKKILWLTVEGGKIGWERWRRMRGWFVGSFRLNHAWGGRWEGESLSPLPAVPKYDASWSIILHTSVTNTHPLHKTQCPGPRAVGQVGTFPSFPVTGPEPSALCRFSRHVTSHDTS